MNNNIISLSDNEFFQFAINEIEASVQYDRLNCKGTILVIDAENYTCYDKVFSKDQICFIFILISEPCFIKIFEMINFQVPVHYIFKNISVSKFSSILTNTLIDLQRRIACLQYYNRPNGNISLSEREHGILDLHLNGATIENIAEHFELTLKTALTYRSSATTKAFNTLGLNAFRVWNTKKKLETFLHTQQRELDIEKLKNMCINCPKLKKIQ